ncbi:restriction endonuclease subunit S [Limosilactobacillus reuteri]|uniref:restriction endonuclease subunit S n=1 Tax=Limosilactobacillus reuteri TaxID=1598 RepID=UPI001E32F0CF|nr:restriction endonuclease subunit S [Limosilactobacillus reuteri]MCC4351404.1 restriction endonuclease subunit S [Limosilactobacillus reuteri]MCC4378002.1 restriction endonuclease subunit S [Limosilactobacillus reuteri]
MLSRLNDNLLKFTTAYFDSVKKEQYVALKKLLDVRDGTHNSPKQQKTGYPLVTSKAIKENTIDFSKTKLISKLDFEEINKRSKVNTNDILVSMIGTVGIIYKVIENPVNFAIKNVGLIKAGETSDLANLVYLYLISKEGQSYINSHLSGSTQQFISLSTLRNLPIPTLDNFTIDQINKIGELLLLITQNSKQNVILTALRNEILNKFF